MSDMISAAFRLYAEHIQMLAERQADRVRQAALFCADALEPGGIVHIHDTGHIVDAELINRAGGLAAFSRFKFDLQVINENRYREANPGEPLVDPNECERLIVRAAIGRSNMRRGDVLIIGTVSGNKFRQIELSLQAQAMGVKVIAVCAEGYRGVLVSQHPCGKLLVDVADLVLDNGAPYGDAGLPVEGLPRKMCPLSGIGAAVLMWAVAAGTVQILIERGKVPSVYPSVNIPVPEGGEGYSHVAEHHKQHGY